MQFVFEEKPKTLEVFQFTGGVDAAHEAGEFVKARDRFWQVSWHMPILDDGEKVQHESIRITGCHGDRVMIVGVNCCIVWDPKTRELYPAGLDDLEFDYRKVEDADA